MASSKDRQRKLARAKFDRQMARRAERERRRRRVLSGVAAGVALLVAVVGGLWVFGAFDDDAADTVADTAPCSWTAQNDKNNTDLTDVGTPPREGFPLEGTRPMTITTNQGAAPIVVTLDLAGAPCAGESMTYLAGRKFFDNTPCHEITASGALHCGDPKGTGHGGPAYAFYSENLPTSPDPAPSASAAPAAGKTPLYPKGTVALIGDPPGTNSSQFLIFFKDYSPPSPEYPIIGRVMSGTETLTKIAQANPLDASGSPVTPKSPITITSLTVGEPSSTGSSPSAAPSASSQS